MKGAVYDEAALVMAAGDTVATALADLEAGRQLAIDEPSVGDEEVIALAEAIEFGHKLALTAHETGDPVRKYGEVIGHATEPIAAGAWVHTHNAESARGRGDLSASGRATETDDAAAAGTADGDGGSA